MANIISSMDQGNGLLDRFIVYVPKSFRPLPDEQITALQMLNTMNIQDVEPLYSIILGWEENNDMLFYFSDDALR